MGRGKLFNPIEAGKTPTDLDQLAERRLPTGLERDFDDIIYIWDWLKDGM